MFFFWKIKTNNYLNFTLIFIQHQNFFLAKHTILLFELRNLSSAKKVNNTNGKLYQLFSLSQRAWIIIIYK
jgi:hypothetical protein